MAEEKSDYQKKELTLNINNFDEPDKLSGPKAWVNMILTLIYMEKGTYKESPEMGIGILNYDFEFVDDIIDELEDQINDQVRIYLPDIPFESASLEEYDLSNGDTALLITINFVVENSDNETDSAVIAIDTQSSSLDFVVSM